MINLEIFIMGLLVISTLTGLVTEAMKKIFAEHDVGYKANTLAGIVAVVLSIAIGVAYGVVTDIPFTSQTAVYLVATMFMSWLCSMIGYDKVIQTISQFKTNKKDDEE